MSHSKFKDENWNLYRIKFPLHSPTYPINCVDASVLVSFCMSLINRWSCWGKLNYHLPKHSTQSFPIALFNFSLDVIFCFYFLIWRCRQDVEFVSSWVFWILSLDTKPIKWHECSAKIHISLGLKSNYEYKLAAGAEKRFQIHVDWSYAQDDLSLCWTYMPFFVDLSWCSSFDLWSVQTGHQFLWNHDLAHIILSTYTLLH